MSSFNECILMGNLTRDSELHYTESQTPVANFDLAVNNKVGEREEVLYMPCVVFGKLADVVIKYTQKGKAVMVAGRLVQERWENSEGQKRSKVKLYIRTLQLLGSPTNKNDSPDEEF